jgi:hypothetical protein
VDTDSGEGFAATSPEVVLASDLDVFLQELEDKFRVEHPKDVVVSNKNEFPIVPNGKSWHGRKTKDLYFFGATDWLAQEAGIHPRRLHTLRKEHKYVGYYVADRILTNLGYQHALRDGTIPVIPNPTWDDEKWAKHANRRCDY